MKKAAIPNNEKERLKDLLDLNILGTQREERFDRLTDLAADVLDAKMAFITLVDANRQWFKSTCGLTGVEETPRDIGFCAHAINESEPMIVLDATKDDRFNDNPFVTGDFGLRSYVGTVIRGRNGQAVGTLCLVDTKPRQSFSNKQIGQLKKIAALVETELHRSKQSNF